MGRRAPTGVKIGLWLTAAACAASALLASGSGHSPTAAAQDSTTVATAPPTSPVSSPPTSPVSTPVSNPPTTLATSPPTTHPSVSTTAPLVTVTTTRPAVTSPPVSYTYQSTTSSSTTSTTIASIFGHLPVSPSTVPLNTKGSNGHFDTKLGWLSAGGFGLAFLIILGRFVTSRPRRD